MTEAAVPEQPPRPAATVLPRYLLVALAARTADEGARISLILLALERTGSAAVGGVLVAVLLVPHVVAAPLVGAAVDRAAHPKRVLAVSIGAVACALLASAMLVGRAPLWVPLVALLIGGCGGPAITGGLTSAVSGLVPQDRLSRAFGLDSLFYNVAGMAGPALVGVVAAALGAAPAQLVLAACAGIAAIGVLGLPVPPRPAAALRRTDLSSGLRWVAKQPALRTVTLASAFGQIGPGGLGVVVAAVAASAHRPAASGLLLAAVAAGSLLGSLLWTWHPLRAERAPLVTTLAMVGIGAPIALTSLVQPLPAVAALLALSGVFIGPFAAALFTTRTAFASEETRTQVFTIGAGLKVSAAALGAVLFGLLAGLPVATQLLLLAASPVVAGAVGTALLVGRGRGPVARR